MRRGWQKIKNGVLGEKYELSVAFVGNPTMKRLNEKYRKKSYSADVLSFPLSKNEGEILINKKYAKNRDYSGYLFVHSLLHLKGFKHGEKMKRGEIRIMAKLYPGKYKKWYNS